MDHKSIKFTAFNIATGTRETFTCLFSSGVHSSFDDAATSKLWYGECWSQYQMQTADVVVLQESKVADAAWFIVRTADTLSGIRSSQIENYLRRSTSSRIESDAEQIQHDHAMPSANAVQKAVVGRCFDGQIALIPA